MQKKKKFRRRFESEAKKINKDVEFYYYSRLIKTFKRTTLAVRVLINSNAKINLINQHFMIQ